MNDIEKKMEALKAEFLGKLEALEKEAEMQKKQEELKSWKPEREEKYFTMAKKTDTILRLATVSARENVPSKLQRKCGYCYGLSSCMICSVRIMCRTGKTMDKSFLFILIMQKTAGI